MQPVRIGMRERKQIEKAFLEGFEHFKAEQLNKIQVVAWLNKALPFAITRGHLDSMLKAEVIPKWYSETKGKKAADTFGDHVEQLTGKVEQLTAKVEQLAQLDTRLAQLETRFTQAESRVNKADGRYGEVIEHIARINKLIDTLASQILRLGSHEEKKSPVPT